MSLDALFIINPISGNGRKAEIEKMLLDKGYTVVRTEYAGHAEILAREAMQHIVVAVGGDGTVNEVARGALDSGKTLGIIPCGSGDGLALHLGISRNPAKALEVIENGEEKPLDWGTIDSRPFFSVCGVGLDADVSYRFAHSGSRGLWTYVKEAFSAWHDFRSQQYSVMLDGKSFLCSPVLITVANSNQWGNNARIAPGADSGDGLLDVVIVDRFSNLEIPVLVFQLMTGRINRNRHVTTYRARNISILRPCDAPAHFDGDCFNAGREVKILIGDNQLKVIAPKSL